MIHIISFTICLIIIFAILFKINKDIFELKTKTKNISEDWLNVKQRIKTSIDSLNLKCDFLDTRINLRTTDLDKKIKQIELSINAISNSLEKFSNTTEEILKQEEKENCKKYFKHRNRHKKNGKTGKPDIIQSC